MILMDKKNLGTEKVCGNTTNLSNRAVKSDLTCLMKDEPDGEKLAEMPKIFLIATGKKGD